MWLYRYKSIEVSHHPAKFGGSKSSGSGVMILVCPMILQNHVIKGLCDFTGTRPWRLSYHSAKLGGHRHLISWLICLIWVKSCTCTCLPNLMTVGLIEMKISILVPILTWIPWKKLYCNPPYCNIFKIQNTDFQFRSPGYSWQKNNNKKKRTKAIAKRCAFHANVIMIQIQF